MATRTKITDMRGTLVWWKFKSFAIDRDKFESLMDKFGNLHVQPPQKNYKAKNIAEPLTYLDLLPKNSYKNALLRALRVMLKNDNRFYKRLRDVADSCTIPVILPVEVFDSKVLADIEFQREVVITLDKNDGSLQFNRKTSFNNELTKKYKELQKTLDAEQLSNILINIVRTQCYGVSIKLGVYYVPEAHSKQLKILEKICGSFKEHEIELFQIPVYSDPESKKAIQAAVEDDLIDRLEVMKEDFAKLVRAGKLSRDLRGNRLSEMNALVKRMEVYKKDLASKAKTIELRLDSFKNKISKYNKFSEDAQKDKGFLDSLLNM